MLHPHPPFHPQLVRIVVSDCLYERIRHTAATRQQTLDRCIETLLVAGLEACEPLSARESRPLPPAPLPARVLKMRFAH